VLTKGGDIQAQLKTFTMSEQILIGGQALRNLGSDRYTSDVDYLINDNSTTETFICSEDIDLINANGNKFFAEIFKIEKGNTEATPQSLFDLKAYSFVQHCQNFNWEKVDACEYDMKFLVRNFGCSPKLVKNHISTGELSEIVKVVNSVKK